MGVTIHFEGRLLDEAAYGRVIEHASRVAAKHGWRCEPLAEESATLARVRNEENWDYHGPTRGLAVYPHPSCEPLRLEFDIDLYLQEYVKTQFAPPEIHAGIIELLDQIALEFAELSVLDEGEYFETRNIGVLTTHMAACFAAMRDEMTKDPTLEGPVRLENGRIADLVRG